MNEAVAQAKQLVLDFARAREQGPAARSALHAFLAPELDWHGIQPLRRLAGPDAFLERFLQPLYTAFPDWQRRPYPPLGGDFEDRLWVAAMGDAIGGLVHPSQLTPALTIQPTGSSLRTRYAEFCCEAAGCSCERSDLRELPDADSQDLVRYWHPQMAWHGPRGVGSSLNLDEFRHLTQGPILRMTPDRIGVGHRARIAEGHFAASTGWPASVGTMSGDFLDWPASGREMRLNVMDFWRREGMLLREDWVLIDMLDAAAQAGVDVWQRAGLR